MFRRLYTVKNVLKDTTRLSLFDFQDTKSYHATVDVHQAKLRMSAMEGYRNMVTVETDKNFPPNQNIVKCS